MPKGVAGGELAPGIDAFESNEFTAPLPAHQHLIVQDWRDRDYVRDAPEFVDQRAPVENALAGVFLFEYVDVRCGGEHVALQRVLKAVIHRERDDESHYARCYSD